jgi:alginate O-acetyltransferase complex protein AlgJ
MISNLSITATKMILPALLFGYAAVANVDVSETVAHAFAKVPETVSGVMHGGFTQDIETIYKGELPHRQLAVELIGAARYVMLGEGRHGVVVGADGWLFSSEEFRGLDKPDMGLATSIQRISAIAKTLRSRGARLIIVPLPTKNDIYRDKANEPRFAEASEARYQGFVSALAAAGIDYADTRAALVAAKKTGPVFLRTDTHWTPLGAKSVALETARETGMLQTSIALDDEKPDVVDGDLVKFVTSGSLAKLVGLGPETVVPQKPQKASEEAVSDLFGNETRFPVALVGTSYSATEAWSFASYLEAALGKDILNVAEVGRGPVFPMRKFLKSETWSDASPAIVIWEFPVRYLTDPDLWSADK